MSVGRLIDQAMAARGEAALPNYRKPKPIPLAYTYAMTAARLLVASYVTGRLNGDHVDWSDVDDAHYWALKATRASQRLIQKERAAARMAGRAAPSR